MYQELIEKIGNCKDLVRQISTYKKSGDFEKITILEEEIDEMLAVITEEITELSDPSDSINLNKAYVLDLYASLISFNDLIREL